MRIVPPSPAQRAADPAAPFLLHFDAEIVAVTGLARALGIPFEPRDDGCHLVARADQVERLATAFRTRKIPLADTLERYLEPVPAWQLRTRALPLDQPLIMGILNLTTDSFSGDGVGHDLARAVEHAATLREAGADIIDVGAESARADRPVLEEREEARLVAGAVRRLVDEGHCVSIDSYKPAVARAALDAGAEIVNDISGLTVGTGAASEAARVHAGYVLNYSYSVPKRRPDVPPVYTDVVAETLEWLAARLQQVEALGLPRAAIAIDPGIAFGKSHDEDLQVLRRLGEFTTFGQPLLLAHSRKNFIASVNGQPPGDRDLETHVVVALAVERGAQIFRVHDVGGARRAATLAQAIAFAPAGEYAPDRTSWPWAAGRHSDHAADAGTEAAPPPGQLW